MPWRKSARPESDPQPQTNANGSKSKFRDKLNVIKPYLVCKTACGGAGI